MAETTPARWATKEGPLRGPRSGRPGL